MGVLSFLDQVAQRSGRSPRRPCARCTVAVCVSFALLCATPTFAQPGDAKPTESALDVSDGPASSLVARARQYGERALEKSAEITELALRMLGVQYKFGGATPESGFDCSGLVRFVFQQVTGLSLPHNALQQSKAGREVTMDELRPGDLVFFNTRRFAFSHVGIYLGDNKFVHSPRKGQVVQVVDLSNPYWKRAFNGARRVLEQPAAALLPAAVAAPLPPSGDTTPPEHAPKVPTAQPAVEP